MSKHTAEIRHGNGGQNWNAEYLSRCAKSNDETKSREHTSIEKALQSGRSKKHEGRGKPMKIHISEELKKYIIQFWKLLGTRNGAGVPSLPLSIVKNKYG